MMATYGYQLLLLLFVQLDTTLVRACVRARVCGFGSVRARVCVCVCVRARACVCVCLCVCVCVCL